jgi:CubicO group peptidase (beta-lactamase class C family)
LRERIFQPLGMTATRVNDLTRLIKNRATGDTWQGDRFRNGEYVSPTQPFAAGALVSTVKDMAKWDAALYTDRSPTTLLSVIQGSALPPAPQDATLEEFEAAMDAFSVGTETLPVLPAEAFTRESIYEGR